MYSIVLFRIISIIYLIKLNKSLILMHLKMAVVTYLHVVETDPFKHLVLTAMDIWKSSKCVFTNINNLNL